MTNRYEREAARRRLQESVDSLAERTNMQIQMQKEPLKLLGGASAVGAVIGALVGLQGRRTKRVYVDVDSPIKHQKALIKAQQQQYGKSMGSALVATLGTLAVKTVTDKIIAPKLEELANNMLEKSGQPPKRVTPPASLASASAAQTTPPLGRASQSAPKPTVEAKAQSSSITEDQRQNPNKL